MLGPNHVSKTGRFDHIAELEVEDEADRELFRIELQLSDRITLGGKDVACFVEGGAFPHVDVVVDQRVIHVVTDRFDRTHIQRAVDENSPLGFELATDIIRSHHWTKRYFELMPRRCARRGDCPPAAQVRSTR